jgi:hypothetical protein
MSEPGVKQDIPDSRTERRRVWGFLVVALLLAFLAYFSIQLAWVTWADRELHLPVRVMSLAVSVFVIALFTYVVGSPLLRKVRTGRFLMTPAEARAKRAEISSCIGAGKPFWPQARFFLIPWFFLAMLAAFGIAALIAAARSCLCLLTRNLLLAALGLALLALPGWYVFKGVSRKRSTGSFLPSEDELAKARAQCAQPKPLRQRILLAGMNSIPAVLWTYSALIGHTRHHSAFGSVWGTAAMWWILAGLWIWQLFRPGLSQCAYDPDAPPSIKPPVS